MQKGVAPEVRSRVVTKLVESIDEAERLAKESGRRSRSGGGGISPKEPRGMERKWAFTRWRNNQEREAGQALEEVLPRSAGTDPWRWRREMEAEFADDQDSWLSMALITRCVDPKLEYIREGAILTGS